MQTHAPGDYRCPFCALVNRTPCTDLHSDPGDIVSQNSDAMAFVASHCWPNNPGHVLIIPVRHFENLHCLPDEVAAAIAVMSRRIATAMKIAYQCEGISTRQHNEPAGDLEVWHYHLHVFPRYTCDGLHGNTQMTLTPSAERTPYAQKLHKALTGEHRINDAISILDGAPDPRRNAETNSSRPYFRSAHSRKQIAPVPIFRPHAVGDK